MGIGGYVLGQQPYMHRIYKSCLLIHSFTLGEVCERLLIVSYVGFVHRRLEGEVRRNVGSEADIRHETS